MTDTTRETVYQGYIANVASAKSEQPKKELFLTLLGRSEFFGDQAADFVSQFAAGAENNIYNIQRKGKKSGHGFADTQYGSVIIEFEDDLRKTGAHAADQLRDYLSGNWNSGIQARFTLITTDCLVWKIWSPDYDTLIRLEGSLSADEIVFDEPRVFDVREHTADEFYFFIDRYLMACDAKPATIDEIKLAFGRGGEVYNAAMRGLYKVYAEIKDAPEMRTAFEQWEKLLSIAYGRFKGSDELFLIHSYLSALAKIMAYVVISGGGFITDGELKSIMTGEAFRAKQVLNFTDEDFFRWMAEHIDDKAMTSALREIANGFDGFNMKSITEDILKGVYQELVDNDMKHSLGEHYTPDWLCAYVVREMDPKRGQKILDPSCGSGSFLKAAANYLIENHPDITAEELNDSLYGIDVHPLSVQITKATVLIAIGERMAGAKAPLILNIFLANTLLLPDDERDKDLFTGWHYNIEIDDMKVQMNKELFNNRSAYRDIVAYCDSLARVDHESGQPRDREEVQDIMKTRFGFTSDDSINSVTALYEALYAVKTSGRNGIWAFIVTNNYTPYFLKNSFDMVIGNPPWLVFKDIDSANYQNEINRLAAKYNILPKRSHSRPNMELGIVFLARCADYFLKDDGRAAFVLPRGIFNAEQHDVVRRDAVAGISCEEVWDLNDVAPLFRIPASVLFAKRSPANEQSVGHIVCKEFSGRLAKSDMKQEDAEALLSIRTVRLSYTKMGRHSAWTYGSNCLEGIVNEYRDSFSLGAIIRPRRLFFVDIVSEYTGALKDRVITVRSSTTVSTKRPWHDISLFGLMNTRFMFETALTNNVVPFALNGTNLIVIPAVIANGKVELYRPNDLMKKTGDIESSKWFSAASKLWEERKTERSSMDLIENINYMNKFDHQPTDVRYIVLYSAIGSNIVATAVDTADHDDLRFIVSDGTYAFFTDDRSEAYFLTAFLNSHIVNKRIKPFQSPGLMGERNIHKKILEVPLPRYDESNPDHRALAELAEVASIKAAAFVARHNFDRKGGSLGPAALGKFRNDVRDHLKDEMAAMDEILERIIGGMA